MRWLISSDGLATLNLKNGASLVRIAGRDDDEEWLLRGIRSPISTDPVSEEEAAMFVRHEEGDLGPFGECPRCGRGAVGYIHAGRNHFGLCPFCRVAFWAGRNLISDTGEKEEQERTFRYWEEHRGYMILDEHGKQVKSEPEDPPMEKLFDRDAFWCWRNRMVLAAQERKYRKEKFSSGGVEIEGTSHMDGGISWVCRFASGGPEFRGSHTRNRTTDLEHLLEQAGVIWWG